MKNEWITLPKNEARVLLSDGMPILILCKSHHDPIAVDLEIEVVTGFRTQCKSLTRMLSDIGWIRTVRYAGQSAIPWAYGNLKEIETDRHDTLTQDMELFQLTGLHSYSAVNWISQEHPPFRENALLVWTTTGGGALGAIYEVGEARVTAALLEILGEVGP